MQRSVVLYTGPNSSLTRQLSDPGAPDRKFTDEVIAGWLRADPVAVARWRAGVAIPGPGMLASLRRLVRSARHD
jgi:hypothetical protein